MIDDTGGVRTFTLDWSDFQEGLRKRAPLLVGFLLVAMILGTAVPAIAGGAIGGVLTVTLMTRVVYRRTALSIDDQTITHKTWSGQDRWRLDDIGVVVFARDVQVLGEVPAPMLLVLSKTGSRVLKLTRPWPGSSLRAIAAALPATAREFLDEPLTMTQLRRRYPAADI